MIQVLGFKKGLSWVTKDTPDLEKHGAFLREIEPVLCRDGLALQKCSEANLYAFIHVPSGHTLNMRCMSARIAEDWFNVACTMADWTDTIEAITADPKVVDALRLAKELEEKYLFPPEKTEKKVEQATLFDMEVTV
jgi:hypothetical protein